MAERTEEKEINKKYNTIEKRDLKKIATDFFVDINFK